MDRLKLVVAVVAMITLPVVLCVCATVPPQAQVKTAVQAKTGDTVRLFYGGNARAKDEFCLNAVVTVYRYSPAAGGAQKSEAGKIRITGIVDDHYMEGVVVTGSIADGDIGVQPTSACLIRLPEGIINSTLKAP